MFFQYEGQHFSCGTSQQKCPSTLPLERCAPQTLKNISAHYIATRGNKTEDKQSQGLKVAERDIFEGQKRAELGIYLKTMGKQTNTWGKEGAV